MSSDAVEVQIKGNEKEAQHGHQISMKDRDPTAINGHVKVQIRYTSLASITFKECSFFFI